MLSPLRKFLEENYGGYFKAGSNQNQCPICRQEFFYVHADETYAHCFEDKLGCGFTVNQDGGRIFEVRGYVQGPNMPKSCPKKKYYELVKKWLLSGMSTNAFRLAMFYWVHSSHTKLFSYYGRTRICKMLGISLSTFKKARRELEATKAIAVVHWRGNKTSRVYINPVFGERLGGARRRDTGEPIPRVGNTSVIRVKPRP